MSWITFYGSLVMSAIIFTLVLTYFLKPCFVCSCLFQFVLSAVAFGRSSFQLVLYAVVFFSACFVSTFQSYFCLLLFHLSVIVFKLHLSCRCVSNLFLSVLSLSVFQFSCFLHLLSSFCLQLFKVALLKLVLAALSLFHLQLCFESCVICSF